MVCIICNSDTSFVGELCLVAVITTRLKRLMKGIVKELGFVLLVCKQGVLWHLQTIKSNNSYLFIILNKLTTSKHR